MHRIIYKQILFFIFLFLGASGMIFADTVVLKDGTRIKGLILDEFKDRLVISTVIGERELMKSTLKSAIYDSEEKALIHEGRNYFKKAQFIKAYYTYKKAAELNPDLKEAKERLYYLRSYLKTKMRCDIIGDVVMNKEREEKLKEKNSTQRAEDELGIVLYNNGGRYVSIEKITNDNLPGAGEELKPYDRFQIVRGEMAAYMDVNEVADVLLVPGEIRITIERTVFPEIAVVGGTLLDKVNFARCKKSIGAVLEFKKDGLTVKAVNSEGPFAKAGIKDGDILHRINGRNTTYLFIQKVEQIIRESEGKKAEVVIKRDVTLWKRKRDI